MSEYYNAQRVRNLYDPKSDQAFKLSRSAIDLFIKCPRCFYIDRKLGTGQPGGFPFTLNSAVDCLLKKEFDIHRAKGIKHPLQKEYDIDAVPVAHEDLDKWRENFVGIQFLHEPTNFLITGAIDDLWQNSKGEYIVVDYKATSKNKKIIALDEKWQDGYKRQMEVYQWLLRQKGYEVSDVGYFVYCNGKTDCKAFDKKLEFEVTLIDYEGSDKWIEKTIFKIKECLDSEIIPNSNPDCDYCNYIQAILTHTKKKALQLS